MALKKSEAIEMVESMIPDMLEFVRGRVSSLLSSGALDLSSAGNDFIIPKLVFAAALHDVAHQYEPLHDSVLMNRYKNLRHF